MEIERYNDGSVYLRTDEAEDVIASLELCQDCLLLLKEQPARWKWLMVALHNAAQGAMACHLSGTAQLGALEKMSARRWLEHLTASRCTRPAPKERLADFTELLSRLSSANKRLELAGPIIQVSEDQKRSLKKLNDLRRGFAHFTPKGWSIELSGMPAIIGDTAAVIGSIADASWAFRHLNEDRARRLSELLCQIRRSSQTSLADDA
jgi:hypothetical protein